MHQRQSFEFQNLNIQTFKKLFLFVFAGFLLSCASTHPGLMAEQPDTPEFKNLIVSTMFRRDLSDKNNFYYEFTFENKDQKWIRIDEAEIIFPSDDFGPYHVVVGKDLQAWANSLKLKSERSDFNEGILTAGSILSGLTMAMIGASRKDTGLTTAGVLVAGAGTVYSGVRDYRKDLSRVESIPTVPDEHLMSPFIIPSNGLIRKWILFNVPTGKITQYANLKMKTIEADELNIKLKLFK